MATVVAPADPDEVDPAVPPPRGAGRGWRAAAGPGSGLALVILVGVGLPYVLALVSGSLSIPHNDDWSYAKTSFILDRSGHLELQGWVGAGMLVQVFLAAPAVLLFGRTPAVVNTTTALWAVVALVSAFSLLRRVLTPRRALAGTALLACFPGFALLSTSYMTDVPGLALALASLAVGAAALDGRRSWPGLAVAVALGLLAFGIREQLLAAPLAVLVAASLLPLDGSGALRLHARWRDRWTLCCVAAMVLVGAVALAYLRWRQGLPNVYRFKPAADLPGGIRALVPACAFLGLATAPAVVLCLAPRLAPARRALPLGGAIVALAAFVFLVSAPSDHLPGNYLTPSGAYPDVAVAEGPRLFPAPVFGALEIVGTLAASAVAVLGVRRLRRPLAAGGILATRLPDPTRLILLVFAGLYVAVCALLTFTTWPAFDRYVLPLVVPAAAALLRGRGGGPGVWRWGISSAAFAGLAVTSVVLAVHSAAFDTARWRAADSVAARGLDPRDITAGLEWSGTHADGPADIVRLGQRPPTGVAWFTPVFRGSRDCVVISPRRLADAKLELVATRRYRSVLVAGRGELFVYRNPACGANGVRPVPSIDQIALGTAMDRGRSG